MRWFWQQDICHNWKEQVALHCAFHADCCATLFWSFFCRPGRNAPEWVPQPFIDSCADSDRSPVLPVPDIDLDVFKICSFGEWQFGEVFFVNVALAFGTPLPFNTISPQRS